MSCDDVGAVEIIFRGLNKDDADKKTMEYIDRFANPMVAAMRGFIDAVIDPADSRKILIESLEVLETKKVDKPWRKHGNIPL